MDEKEWENLFPDEKKARAFHRKRFKSRTEVVFEWIIKKVIIGIAVGGLVGGFLWLITLITGFDILIFAFIGIIFVLIFSLPLRDIFALFYIFIQGAFIGAIIGVVLHFRLGVVLIPISAAICGIIYVIYKWDYFDFKIKFPTEKAREYRDENGSIYFLNELGEREYPPKPEYPKRERYEHDN